MSKLNLSNPNKLKENSLFNIDQEEMGQLIEFFARIKKEEENSNLAENLQQDLFKMNKQKTKKYNCQNINFFCGTINSYLKQNLDLQEKYKDILINRKLIGLKIELLLKPDLFAELQDFLNNTSLTEVNTINAEKWIRNKSSRDILKYFIKRYLDKKSTDKEQLFMMTTEVHQAIAKYQLNERIDQFKEFKENNHINKFTFHQSMSQKSKWEKINELLNTGYDYYDIFVFIETESNPINDKMLRFPNLYKILYDTKYFQQGINEERVLAEMKDLKLLADKKFIRSKFHFYHGKDHKHIVDKRTDKSQNRKRNKKNINDLDPCSNSFLGHPDEEYSINL